MPGHGQQAAPDGSGFAGGTAEIMTKACASGQSSVMLRSIRASYPGGVSSSSRASAPPVRCMVGRPPGRFTTPMSRHQTPLPDAGTQRLGTGLLGGKPLGVGRHHHFLAFGAALGLGPLDVGENAVEKALAVALDDLGDAA